MNGYSTREVSALLDLPVEEVRSLAQVLGPERGLHGEYRFTFQDLVVLRSAKGLTRELPVRKVRSSLQKAKKLLGTDRPLNTVRLTASGSQVVVQDGGTAWDADSGQTLFDFAVLPPEAPDRPSPDEPTDLPPPPAVLRPSRPFGTAKGDRTAEDWFQLGCEVESEDPARALDAYRQALKLDAAHVAANLNMGHLYHQERNLPVAELHYRRALEAAPENVTAAFNLGVVLEDLGRREEALAMYEESVRLDPALASAHYNLALLYERAGKKASAIRHFKAYKKLVPEA